MTELTAKERATWPKALASAANKIRSAARRIPTLTDTPT